MGTLTRSSQLFSFRLPLDVADQLRFAAQESAFSMSEITAMAIRDYLQRDEYMCLVMHNYQREELPGQQSFIEPNSAKGGTGD